MKTMIVFVAAFLGSLGLTLFVTQHVDGSNAIGVSNQTASVSNLTSPGPVPSNQSIIAQNISRVNVTLMGTNAILNVDPVTFQSTLQVIGEVFNNGTENINSTNFIIPATLYDANGTIVGTFSTVPELAVIDANNSSPFKVTFFDTDVKNGILGALFYKVQADNKSLFGTLPPPPPFVLGGAIGAPLPGGVPLGFPPMGPFMGGPAIPLLGPAPGLPIPIPGNLTNQTRTNQNQSQTQPINQSETQPITIEEGPDESCLFDTQQPKCAAVNGECPTGFNMNEDENCFPQHERCPDGYHSEEDNESGECYPDSRPCPQGQVMDPDFPTCVNLTVQFCEQHTDIQECKELLDEQVALSSNTTNANQTNGEEQEEEVQGEEGQKTTAGPASVLSGQSGQQQQQVNIEEDPQQSSEEQKTNEENNEEEEED
jgi:hypothetical protein